ncbi:hypothetical protein GW17_00062150 [Ensete ventricosum]|nr:hypothetical protein GW17_00062150 [Ensete ventricosum]
MARPPTWVASHGQATCRGDRSWPKPLTRVASPQGAPASGHAQLQGATARGEAVRGHPIARATACKGDRGQERPPSGTVPTQGGAAHPRGDTQG